MPTVAPCLCAQSVQGADHDALPPSCRAAHESDHRSANIDERAQLLVVSPLSILRPLSTFCPQSLHHYLSLQPSNLPIVVPFPLPPTFAPHPASTVTVPTSLYNSLSLLARPHSRSPSSFPSFAPFPPALIRSRHLVPTLSLATNHPKSSPATFALF